MKQEELLNWYLMSTTLMCDTVSRAYFVIFVFDICELAYYPPCTAWASKELFDGAMLSRHVTSHKSFPSSIWLHARPPHFIVEIVEISWECMRNLSCWHLLLSLDPPEETCTNFWDFSPQKFCQNNKFDNQEKYFIKYSIINLITLKYNTKKEFLKKKFIYWY